MVFVFVLAHEQTERGFWTNCWCGGWLISEEVILNEDRTTEDERRYIMEARKRAMQKRKKLRTLGKSRSTESEDEEEEEAEGEILDIPVCQIIHF